MVKSTCSTQTLLCVFVYAYIINFVDMNIAHINAYILHKLHTDTVRPKRHFRSWYGSPGESTHNRTVPIKPSAYEPPAYKPVEESDAGLSDAGLSDAGNTHIYLTGGPAGCSFLLPT